MGEHDRDRGLYGKFNVTRTDGSSEPGGKHDGCNYFVLDMDHDPYALPALKAYALACRFSYPALARDLMSLVVSRQPCAEYHEVRAIVEGVSETSRPA